MDSTININLVPKDEIKVFYGTEAHIDNKASVLFIKSGEAEIQKYVDEVSKPEISNYVETEAKPLVTQIVNEIAEPTVMEYIEGTVKPDLDEYADSLKPELQAYVTQASEYADNSQASATASAGSAAAALTSANNAKTSETNAKTYESNALSSKNAAASSATSASNYANNSKIWAEGTDAQVQALGGTKSAKGWAEASTNLDYTNITNCITAIPQDIKLELNNGTLTLKAGSQPRDGKGNVISVNSDVVLSGAFWSGNDDVLLFYRNSTLVVMTLNRCSSGTSAPSSPSNFDFWYDTTNKIVKRYNGSSWDEGYSLPLAQIHANNNQVTSIDQVFNGFGYIGSTIFALPNVEGLIPNGFVGKSRNNTKQVINNVRTYSLGDTATGEFVLQINKTGLGIVNLGWYKEVNTLPNYTSLSGWSVYYLIPENFMYLGNRTTDWSIQESMICGSFTCENGRITSFSPKTVFQAVDYYDFKQLDDSAAKLDEDNVFTGYNTLNNAIPILYGKNTADLTNANGIGLSLRGTDNAGNLWSYIDLYRRGESKTSEAHMYARNAGGAIAQIAVAINDDGIVTTSAATPVIGSNNNNIATTAFVNSFFNTAGRVTGKCVPNYAAGVSINSGYTFPANGIVKIHIARRSAYDGTTTINYDGNSFVFRVNNTTDVYYPFSVESGKIMTWTSDGLVDDEKIFYPFKGN